MTKLLSVISGAVIFLFLTSGTPSTPHDFNGIIEGVVELPQTQPSAGARIGRYRRGAPASSAATADQSVLIWIESDRVSPQSHGPVTLDQQELEFVPSILAVRQHQFVRILNSDPVYHNVFSLSSIKRFDVGRRPKGEYLDVQFERQGVVEVFCDIHSNMHAVIYVVSPQTYTWTSESAGSPFRLSQIPDGSYMLHVYSPGFNLYSTNITVENGSADLGTITLSP